MGKKAVLTFRASKRWILVILLALIVSGLTVTSCYAAERKHAADRLKEKASVVKEAIIERKKQGQDVSGILETMEQVTEKAKKGRIGEAEAILDRLLSELQKKGSVPTKSITSEGRSQGGVEIRYEKIHVRDERNDSGIYDPSVEYDSQGRVGWLAYSSLGHVGRVQSPFKGFRKNQGPYIYTNLAKSNDNGKTWRFIKAVNVSTDGTLTNGRNLPGVWRYEVPSLVYDPDDPGREWKLFTHKYFWNEKKYRMPLYGWIAYRYASDPSGQWSKEVPLFGAGKKFPPKPYDVTKVRVNELDRSLRGYVAYSEPGTLYWNGTIYVSLTALKGSGPDRIVLLSSEDHGNSWVYVNALVTRKDAAHFDYDYFDGSSLAEEGGRIFLLMAPGHRGDNGPFHNGTMIVEFEDVTRGNLKRDQDGNLMVFKYLKPQSRDLHKRVGAGQSDYHKYNTYGGLIMAQLIVSEYPKVWQIFNTKQGLLKSNN